MKRIISLILCIATVLSASVIAASAAQSGSGVRISDSAGDTGYSAGSSWVNERVKEDGGATVVFDVMVESFTEPDGGRFAGITAFTGGPGYNYLTYDFTESAFRAVSSDAWIAQDQSGSAEVMRNPFDWETGRWYELAMRFNGNKAAIYLNGICVISTEFDAAVVDYLILYPQFCTLRIDNIRVCARDYNVADGTGLVWAREDFEGISSVEDVGDMWYLDPTYYTVSSGCSGIVTSTSDPCVSFSDTAGNTGYASGSDKVNALVKETGGVTLIFDVTVNSYEEVSAGYFPQIVAFTGDSPYNYASYDFLTGRFRIASTETWVTSSLNETFTEIASSAFDWELGKWYEMAFQYNGSTVTIWLDGAEMLTAELPEEHKYIILYPQFCDLMMDDIKVCAGDYNVAEDTGLVWATEDFAELEDVGESAAWFFNEAYSLSGKGKNSIILGDVNGDGLVSTVDSNILRRALSGAAVEMGEGADINMDGVLNIVDAQLLTRILQGYKYSPDLGVIINEVAVDNSAVIEESEPEPEPEPDPDTPVIGESVDFSTTITTAWELANRAAYVAQNYKTLYVMGCFGAPMNDTNKDRYTQNHSYNKDPERTEMIMNATSDTFGFDCVCLIKGLMWGWKGDTSKTYGGASYLSNGVPDINADKMIGVCDGVTTDFSEIEIGEVVWMEGHIGVYIGGGLAVECSPKWDNCVQITAVGNIGTVEGYNTRTWVNHGKLPYVTYTGVNDNVDGTTSEYISYTVVSGDTLSGIGAKYGVSYLKIAEYNGIESPYTIHVGQVIKIPLN